jgi:hypothetical protein
MLERVRGRPVYRKSKVRGSGRCGLNVCKDATIGKSLRIEPPPRHVHYNPEFVCVSSEGVLRSASSRSSAAPSQAALRPLYILRRSTVSGRRFAQMKSKYRLGRNGRSGQFSSRAGNPPLGMEIGHARLSSLIDPARSASTFPQFAPTQTVNPGSRSARERRMIRASRCRPGSPQPPALPWPLSPGDHIA